MKSNVTMLLPHMGEGIMPDVVPVTKALRNMGVNVIDADLSIPEIIRNLDWQDIDLIDLRYTRGSLTSFDKYTGIIHRLNDFIEKQAAQGHSIKMVPGYDEILWIASKANYFGHLKKHSVEMIPTSIIHRHSVWPRPSTEDPDNIEDAIKGVFNHLEQSHGKKFVLKPSLSSLAKKIVFIDCHSDGSYELNFPHIDEKSRTVTYATSKEFSEFLRNYFEYTVSPDESFLVQDYVLNLEISAVFVDGLPHFIEREPGEESHVAHYRYGGKDSLLKKPSLELVKFVRKIYQALPLVIQNSPFLRIDVMWDKDKKNYIFGEIEGAGAARLWIEEAGRVEDYASMLLKLAAGDKIDLSQYNKDAA